ncbi:MAG: ABC transporter substrate-binding protein [Oscillospiraceae bacterium]
MKNKVLALILAAGLLVGTIACNNQPATPSSELPPSESASTTESAAPEESSEETAEQSPESTAAEAESGHYPVTITTYNYAGDAIETVYEKAPEKVLAVYQGSAETMIALGLEDHVVKSYGLDNEIKEEWQAGFEKMNYDDSVFAPDKETVVMLEPDMIFSWGSFFGEKKLGDVDYWIENGTNPYINSNTRSGGHPRTLENEYTDILNIGKIFDVEADAQAIVDEMKNEIADVLSKTSGQEKQSVAIIEFMDPVTNYGAASLGGDMVTQLGGELAMPEVPSIGNEDLIAADPDVIFVVYMAYAGEDGEDEKQTQLAKILEEPAFASLSAVQNERVYPIMLGDMYASAVRTMDGIQTFAQGLYPDLYAAE